jgi:hypothetical protein
MIAPTTSAVAISPAERLTRLLHSLAVASALEHGLCLQYLFTAFSLKQSLDEGGLTFEELIAVRRWRGNLLFVAAQEMLHLAQAANIGTAVGSGLNVSRPNFPQRPDYYPTGLPWGLWPFSRDALVLYALYERPVQPHAALPAWLADARAVDAAFARLQAQAPAEKDPFNFLPDSFDRPRASGFTSVGELYLQIAEDLREGGDIFHGLAAAQVAPLTADHPQLLQVFDLEHALQGVELIVTQGEGSPSDRIDSHFGMFVAMVEELDTLSVRRPQFQPVRDVQSNPLSRLHADNTYPGWRLIEDRFTREVNDLCSETYALMLLLLEQVFWPDDATQNERRVAAGLSLRLMTGVIPALGDLLTQLPMGDEKPSRAAFAGPSFEIADATPALRSRQTTRNYVRGALLRLERMALGLAQEAPTSLARDRLEDAAATYRDMAHRGLSAA